MGNIAIRYLFWSICGFYVFIGYALTSLVRYCNRITTKQICAVSITLLVIAATVMIPNTYESYLSKSNYREACAILSNEIQSNDALVYSPPWITVQGSILFYYDFNEHGIDTYKYENKQQIIDLSNNPKYNRIFVLIDHNYGPYKFLSKLPSEKCTLIYDNGKCMHLYKINESLKEIMY